MKYRPVEGEVEMDASGEGYVNMGTVKVNSYTQYSVSSSSLLCAMRFHVKNLNIPCAIPVPLTDGS